MAIAFRCPHCRALVQAPADGAGLHLPCPRCHVKVEVPIQKEAPVDPQRSAASIPGPVNAAFMLSMIGFFCGFLSLFCCAGYYAGPFGIIVSGIGLALSLKWKPRFAEPKPLAQATIPDEPESQIVPSENGVAADAEQSPSPELLLEDKTRRRAHSMLLLAVIAALFGLITSVLGILVSVGWLALNIGLSL